MPERWVVPEKDFKICAAHFQPDDLYESSGRLFMYTSKGKPYAKPEIFVAPITPKKYSAVYHNSYEQNIY
jgi:hypothetical protein